MDTGHTFAFLSQAVVLLAAGVAGVWLSKRLGFGAIIGYLAAGLAVGPFGLGLFHDSEAILHFAELGVVLLLFVIGLELQPTRLWSMRRAVFGLGSLQLLGTGALLAVVALAYGYRPGAAVVVGLTLALSSTAFALQALSERNEVATRHGRAAFSILLFQDLAVIPLLAAVPVIAGGGADAMDSGRFLEAVKVITVLIAVVAIGRIVLRYGFRLVAEIRVREIFAAAALLTVVGTALLMESLGLSMALGAFLAGVLLADSEYRHALEADIDPFKGLLLGLFFLAVGMSVNLPFLLEELVTVVAGIVVLVAVKAAVLYAIGRWHGLSGASARTLAAGVSQGGEFAFVLLFAAVGSDILRQATADLLTLVVIGSMLTTPLLLMLNDRLRRPARQGEPQEAPGGEAPVIIAGFGRVGQIIGRILHARGIGFTALDSDPEQIRLMRKFGHKVHYGDGARLDLLRAAGAEQALALVVAVDDPETVLHITRLANESFPRLRVHARARNRREAYRLIEAGADHVMRETFLSSLEMTRQLLVALGLGELESRRLVESFRQHDEARLAAAVAEHTDEERMVYLAQRAAQELEELFTEDEAVDPLERKAG